MSYRAPTEIQYPSRYEAAVAARIKYNAKVGRGRRWLAEDETRAALIERLDAALEAGHCSDFVIKMYEAYREWGTLTAGQEAALRNALDRGDARSAEFAARRAAEHTADAASSAHVGTVGERRVFTATIGHIHGPYEGTYGVSYIYVMHDAAGNVIVYRGGTELGARGESVTFKATVKEHGERDGVKQTTVARPKMENVTC